MQDAGDCLSPCDGDTRHRASVDPGEGSGDEWFRHGSLGGLEVEIFGVGFAIAGRSWASNLCLRVLLSLIFVAGLATRMLLAMALTEAMKTRLRFPRAESPRLAGVSMSHASGSCGVSGASMHWLCRRRYAELRVDAALLGNPTLARASHCCKPVDEQDADVHSAAGLHVRCLEKELTWQ